MRILTPLLYCCFINLNQFVSLNQPKSSDQFLVFVNGEKADALRIANKYGFRLMYEIFPKRFVFQRNEGIHDRRNFTRSRTSSLLARESRVLYFQQQQYNIRVLRNSSIAFNDSKWKDMWYYNLNTSDVIPDQGILRAWSHGYTGRGIKIAIVDNGVETKHPDLIANQVTELAYNFMDGTTNPSPDSGASHGTKCAGIATAVANNGHCIMGAAYEAKFVALKMMDNIGSTSTSEAGALSYRINDIDIYTNSWGPIDRIGFHRPNSIVIQALENGIRQGRNGKGSVFVWAAGNGGPDDNCNCDGYVNSIYTIAITGVGYDMYPAYYSEPCSVIMACTYGSDDLEYFVETTDLNGQCGRFSGTSATAPMAAGILSMTLQANKNLTWRDIQYLIVQTSKPHNLKGTWKTNAAGKLYHEYFGFGLMDANALTEEAERWIGLPNFRKCSSVLQISNLNVDHLNTAEDVITSDGCNSTTNYVEYLEHVQVHIKFSANHHKDVLLSIISPANTESHLLSGRPYDNGSGQLTWVFSSVHFWGETSRGNWTIRMSIPVNTNQGQLHAWQLHLHGTSVHPSQGPDNETESDIDENGEVSQILKRNSGLSALEASLIILVAVIIFIVICIFIIIYLIKCRKCKRLLKTCGGKEVKPQQ